MVFTIAPLNLDQVDSFVLPLAAGETPRDRQWAIVLAGLNNAGPTEPYTLEGLKPEMDILLLRKLQMDVFEFSGLSEVPSDGAASGETRAAPQS